MTTLLQGAQIQMIQGTTYRGRVRLTGFEALVGGASDVKKALEGNGFSSVQVWTKPPSDWPADQLGPEPSGDTYYCQAVWNDKSRVVNKDQHITAVWVHAAPAKKKADWAALAVLSRAALRDAWKVETKGEPLPLDVEQAVLAIGHFEGSWGYPENDPVWWGSNNWGAISVPGAGSGSPWVAGVAPPPAPAGAFAHKDHDAKGNPIWQFYKQYATPQDGAQDLVHELRRRQDAWKALFTGNVSRLADAMHASGYFVAKPAVYAQAVFAHAKVVASLLGEPLRLRLSTSPWAFVVGAVAVGGLAGGGYWWYHRR